MQDHIQADSSLEISPIPSARAFKQIVQKFRFLPESYLTTLGPEWDTGVDILIYLRMFVEEETEETQ